MLRLPHRIPLKPSSITTRLFTTTLLRPTTEQTPNVSETNAVPTSTTGARDETIVEPAEEGERQRQLQAPNRTTTWARSQQERSKAMVGPRFEQTVMEFQVRLLPHEMFE
jgi:NADH dehydrogenase (ubiquinone) Fe-S protein 6